MAAGSAGQCRAVPKKKKIPKKKKYPKKEKIPKKKSFFPKNDFVSKKHDGFQKKLPFLPFLRVFKAFNIAIMSQNEPK